MAFVISKKSNERGEIKKLYYLVQNYRDGDKIKRRTLLSLKEYKTVAELLEATEQEYEYLVNRLRKFEKEREDFLKYGKTPQFTFGSAYQYKKRMERMGWGIGDTKVEIEACQKRIEEIKSFL